MVHGAGFRVWVSPWRRPRREEGVACGPTPGPIALGSGAGAWAAASGQTCMFAIVSLSLRLKDLLGPVTRVKKKKKKVRVLCSPFYGRACRWAMLGELKT